MSIVWKFLRLYSLLEWMNIVLIYVLNERASTIQDDTGTTGLVSEPQL